MATVDGITAARGQEIADASVVSGAINPINGHLILEQGDGTEIDAGAVTSKVFTEHQTPSADVSITTALTVMTGLSIPVTSPVVSQYIFTLDANFTIWHATNTPRYAVEFILYEGNTPLSSTLRVENKLSQAGFYDMISVSKNWRIDIGAGTRTYSVRAIATEFASGTFQAVLKSDRTKLTVIGGH